MRELGRKGGRGRRGPNTERVHPSLREFLRAQVPPEQIWQALRAAMEGENQSAKVAASRVLMDALAEPREEEDRAAHMEQVGVDARAKLEQLIQRRATRLHRAGKTELAGEFHEAAAELWAEGEKAVTSSGVLVGDRLSSADARAVLEGLLELGLLRRATTDEIEEYEQLRQENARLRRQLEEL
jgi:hypothetical protein